MGETTPKIDESCTGDHDGTYTVMRNKLERIKGQRKMKRISFSSYKPKWLVKLIKENKFENIIDINIL